MAFISFLPRARKISEEIARCGELRLLPINLTHFPDGEILTQVSPNEEMGEVFFVQLFDHEVNECLAEALFALDALKRSGYTQITLVTPYLPYCRQARARNSKQSIGAELLAKLFADAGVRRLIGFDFHERFMQQIYTFPVIELTVVDLLVATIRSYMSQCSGEKLCVVAPDSGAQYLAQRYAELLCVPLVQIDKRRCDAEHVEVISVKGDLLDKVVLLADDVCSTAGTLASAAKACRGKGAQKIFAVVSHALLVGEAKTLLTNAGISLLWTTDSCLPLSSGCEGRQKANILQTLDSSSEELFVCISSIAPLLAGCIKTL